MSDFLVQMADASRQRAGAGKRRYRDAELDAPLYPLSLENFDLIAELKDSSPSEGRIATNGLHRLERAERYAQGGAAAVSVLTEPSRFAGSLEHLTEAARALAPYEIPVMRKDFLVDPVQLYEARACGAGGVLLIAAILDDVALAEMLACAFYLGMFVVLESFEEKDLKRTAALMEEPRFVDHAQAGRLLAGVNARDLRTLKVDGTRLKKFARKLPADIACVAESGLETAKDVASAAGLGYRLGLVGTALMKHDEPELLLREMIAAGRARASKR